MDHDRRRMRTAMVVPATLVVVMWIVLGFDEVYGLNLADYGIFPRTLVGLRGILLAPLIHGGVEHLFSNSVPLLILGWFTIYFYPKASGRVFLLGWIATNCGVWLIGRESFHIGASGLVYALASFTFFSGLFRRRIALMAVSMIVVFLYGSMWWGVLPLQPGVSWESHLCGGIVGMVLAWYYRKVPPAHVAPPRPVEPDDEDGDDGETITGGDPGDEYLPPPVPPAPGDGPLYDPERTSSTWR